MNDVLQNALVAAFTLRIDRHSSCMSCRVSGWWWDGGGMVVWWCCCCLKKKKGLEALVAITSQAMS
jgi:hypothetical protein